jgi:hypothetical protein
MKGLLPVFLVIAFIIIGIPILALMAMVGLEEYARYCNVSWLPCFGISR